MTDEKESSSAAVMLAFLSGAAIGAIAALLLAPQSGEETQRRLRSLARKAAKELRQATGQAQNVWAEAVEQGCELLKDKEPLLAEAIAAGRKAINRVRARATAKKKE